MVVWRIGTNHLSFYVILIYPGSRILGITVIHILARHACMGCTFLDFYFNSGTKITVGNYSEQILFYSTRCVKYVALIGQARGTNQIVQHVYTKSAHSLNAVTWTLIGPSDRVKACRVVYWSF